MSEYTAKELINTAKELINETAAIVITDVVSDMIYKDPHQWSERGCSTCEAISAITKKPFGCIKYSIEMRKRRESKK